MGRCEAALRRMNHRILALGLLLAGQFAKDWQSAFPVDKKTLGVKGANPTSS
jgi:hypothetical protein